MNCSIRCTLIAIVLLGSSSLASAKYRIPPRHQVFGTSALIVVGEVTALEAKIYTVRLTQVVAGDLGKTPPKTLRILRRPRTRRCVPQDPDMKVGSKLVLCLTPFQAPKGHPNLAGTYRSAVGTPMVVGKKKRVQDGRMALPAAGKKRVLPTLKEYVVAIRAHRAAFRYDLKKPYQAPKRIVNAAKFKALCDTSPLARQLLTSTPQLKTKIK